MKKLLALLITCCSVFHLGAQAESAVAEPCDTQALRQIALNVLKSNIVDCKIQKDKKCFRAGTFWNQFWVRDTSYSSLMGLYKLYPAELKNTFQELVMMNGKKGYPIQDPAADFGSFPYQTDSIVWVIGAFELAKKTGDEDFRKYVYGVAKKMRIKWLSAVDYRDGLLYGAPSFLDSWASFPKEWQGKKSNFRKNKFLSTNVLWLRFEQIINWEGRKYGDISEQTFLKKQSYWEKRIKTLNEKFYDPQKQYYTYYIGSDRYEGLGNALIEMFKFNLNPIKNVQTAENFYPAHFPMYDFKIPNNWYSETVQHTWVDNLVAAVAKEPVEEFCSKYNGLVITNQGISELIQGGKMFGGENQLWSAMALHFYLDSL